MMYQSKSAFSTWLYRKINESGMSVKKIAKEIGVSGETVRKHLYCGMYPGIDTLERYAKYFGENVWDLRFLVVEDKQNKIRDRYYIG